MFVSPDQPIQRPVTPTGPAAWVAQGGVLIHASEQGDPELDRASHVTRGYTVFLSITTQTATPVLDGVNHRDRGLGCRSVLGILDAGPICRQRLSAGYIPEVRVRSLVVLAGSLLLCNGYLEKSDTGGLLSIS